MKKAEKQKQKIEYLNKDMNIEMFKLKFGIQECMYQVVPILGIFKFLH